MTRNEYIRKSFTVVAEEVTFENVNEIAAWCKGKVVMKTTKLLGTETKLPVVVLKGQGENRGKTFEATLGCYVVELKGSFRVYKNKQFDQMFDPKFVGTSEDHIVCVNAGSTLEEVEAVKELTNTEKVFGTDSLVARITNETVAQFVDQLEVTPETKAEWAEGEPAEDFSAPYSKHLDDGSCCAGHEATD